MQSMLMVRVYEEEVDPVLTMFKSERQQYSPFVDYHCLQEYDVHNKHFTMEVVTIQKQEEDEVIEMFFGYQCTYRYETHEVKLLFDAFNEIWTLDLDKNQVGNGVLKISIENINKFSRLNTDYTLDEQIQYLLRMFDDYFFEVDQVKKTDLSNRKFFAPSLAFRRQYGFEYVGNRSMTELFDTFYDHQKSHPTVVENVQEPNSGKSGLSSISSSNQKNDRRSPLTTCVQQRRVIQSILVRVERKKSFIRKIIDVFHSTNPLMIHDLGVEFLRIYDGQFNYRQGTTLRMCFRKTVWFLTIQQIDYVNCPINETGPRSVLQLNYKGRYTICVSV